MIVLDTCALLWWTLEPQQLSQNAKRICADIDRVGAFISSITIWEIGIKMKKGTLDIGMELSEYVRRLQQTALEIVAVDEALWMKNLQLDWPHRDPADRTIVATAMRENLPILSKDQIIRDFYANTIW
jgi:PIN domain nuclease of toxin-antitoxin system